MVLFWCVYYISNLYWSWTASSKMVVFNFLSQKTCCFQGIDLVKNERSEVLWGHSQLMKYLRRFWELFVRCQWRILLLLIKKVIVTVTQKTVSMFGYFELEVKL